MQNPNPTQLVNASFGISPRRAHEKLNLAFKLFMKEGKRQEAKITAQLLAENKLKLNQ